MEFIAVSSVMREVLQQVQLVRDSGVAVLVSGEAGTGKEKVARTIHHTGIRCREPFVHVDCSELPADVLGTVLFGDRDEGRFELAGAGTLFLDGIDTLPLELQQRLLEVLERSTITRDGGKQIVPVRARLVAASHRDLRELVEADEFRKDLFCRLNVFPIGLPPLRDRREDIPRLATHFLATHQHERTPPVQGIEDRAIEALKAYDWPQNVRELETVVLGAVLSCDNDGLVRIENLPTEISALAPAATQAQPPGPAPVPTPQLEDDTIVPLAELERRAIAHALRVTGGNVTRAARALGIGRATMYRKLDRFKLTTS